MQIMYANLKHQSKGGRMNKNKVKKIVTSNTHCSNAPHTTDEVVIASPVSEDLAS
jgi:hypothetical protein